MEIKMADMEEDKDRQLKAKHHGLFIHIPKEKDTPEEKEHKKRRQVKKINK